MRPSSTDKSIRLENIGRNIFEYADLRQDAEHYMA